ncbi:hypothetical protein LOK49_LG09G01834 [Camellia lanceoleosa]|uniref:Uncharacterized protein n=1 Tax=Camellia lanceoleosa TaxID=1840588 RepID=A0ACC0GG44_9ERIC|nr:hypothetical protein LOK49_LG09G01834 [Camellia lanceoleosa]
MRVKDGSSKREEEPELIFALPAEGDSPPAEKSPPNSFWRNYLAPAAKVAFGGRAYFQENVGKIRRGNRATGIGSSL